VFIDHKNASNLEICTRDRYIYIYIIIRKKSE